MTKVTQILGAPKTSVTCVPCDPVRAVLPLCGHRFLFGGKNPLLMEKPNVGRVCRDYGKTLEGAFSPPLGGGKQSVRLSA